MPEDPGILKTVKSNGSSPGSNASNVTLEELEQFIYQWVRNILSTIEPPAGLWERIKQRAQQNPPLCNPFGS